jgi:hypothetical protein
MKVNKLIPEQVIPAVERDETVINIDINIKDKIAMIKTIDIDDHERFYSATFGTQWDAMTTTQKNTVTAFFKGLVKIALAVTDTDIEE